MELASYHMIPAWSISALAFLAVITLARVRQMPWRIRLSICIPLAYFGAIYLWAAVTPLDAFTRTDFIRFGFIMFLVSVITNAIMARHYAARGR